MYSNLREFRTVNELYLRPIIHIGAIIVLWLFNSTISLSQDKFVFNIKYDTVSSLDNFKSAATNKVLYRDSKYKVTKTCSGEWGGTIIFTDLLLRRKYQTSATCPDIVFKYEDSYYVIANLQHLMPSTEILRIDNPKLMERRGIKGIRRALSRRFFESESNQGAYQMLDTFNIQTLMKVEHQNELYFIVSQYELNYNSLEEVKSTFIAKIKNNQLIRVQELISDYMFIMDIKPYNVDQISMGYYIGEDGKYAIKADENDITIFIQVE